jgi:hypothetical protein
MSKEQKRFEEWWDAKDDIPNNGPWTHDTPIQFAWAGWQAALPQLEQEPVAKYIGECSDGALVQLYDDLKKGAYLYTTPPAAQRKPLSDEEIDDLSRTMVKGNKSVNWLCQAIEAAHGIKGDT